jgi:hypothetical protein
MALTIDELISINPLFLTTTKLSFQITHFAINLWIELPLSSSHASIFHYFDVFVFVLLLSAGWAGEIWEPSEVMLSHRLLFRNTRKWLSLIPRIFVFATVSYVAVCEVLIAVPLQSNVWPFYIKYRAEDRYHSFFVVCRVWTVSYFDPCRLWFCVCACVHGFFVFVLD